MNAQELQTIRGFVQALPKGPGGEEAVRVAVITEDGTPYHVLHKGAGTGLLSNINADVEVTGIVSPLPAETAADSGPDNNPDNNPASNRDSGGDNGAETAWLVTVKSFRLTDGFDDPWYDDTVR